MTGMHWKSGVRLESLCWCGQTYVFLSVEKIRAGQTASCGQEACREGSPLGNPPERSPRRRKVRS